MSRRDSGLLQVYEGSYEFYTEVVRTRFVLAVAYLGGLAVLITSLSKSDAPDGERIWEHPLFWVLLGFFNVLFALLECRNVHILHRVAAVGVNVEKEFGIYKPLGFFEDHFDEGKTEMTPLGAFVSVFFWEARFYDSIKNAKCITDRDIPEQPFLDAMTKILVSHSFVLALMMYVVFLASLWGLFERSIGLPANPGWCMVGLVLFHALLSAYYLRFLPKKPEQSQVSGSDATE